MATYMASKPRAGTESGSSASRGTASHTLQRQSEQLRTLTKKSEREKRKKQERQFFHSERDSDNANPDPNPTPVSSWRMKERMKTVAVALTMALNIGVDPPDVVKTSPCARQECWIDPQTVPSGKALEAIGKALQAQYEHWQGRARYKRCLDPTVDEVKKLCLALRRNAKEERVLFHYNGHGVPRPTNNGELWVFNKNYTQYIPLSIYDLQSWVGCPSTYIFDCSAAGLIMKWFHQFSEQRQTEQARLTAAGTPSTQLPVPMKDYILLAACQVDEILPMNPELPADVFTACLTTPIRMALRWGCQRSILTGIEPEMIDKIPGRLKDRRTVLGELNWIFTAITDTIAWNVLEPDLFQRLFRQDLLVASLFRNFLLAERIMRSLNCTPMSYPKLPPTYQHPMWEAWDLAADICLSQLPNYLANPKMEINHNPFFAEQLTAFEVWLEFGSEGKKPPEQLPIVLQVLLSQAHRLRALQLLARFLDLGPWAVNLALSVGIFPYVLKLLQSPAADLREVLVFIWTKILALDRSCQIDLVKDNGHNYFMNVLASNKVPTNQRTMAAFVLSVIMDRCPVGQSACLNSGILQLCLKYLNDRDPLLRRWVVCCIARLWDDFQEAKWAGIRESAHERLCVLLTDPVPEVRAAAVHALGTFIGGGGDDDQRRSIEVNIGLTFPVVTADGSPMVRKELIVALSHLVNEYESQFVDVAIEIAKDEMRILAERKRDEGTRGNKSKKKHAEEDRIRQMRQQQEIERSAQSRQSNSVYACPWKVLLSLSHDPYPELAKLSKQVIKSIQDKIQDKVGPQFMSQLKSSRTTSPMRGALDSNESKNRRISMPKKKTAGISLGNIRPFLKEAGSNSPDISPSSSPPRVDRTPREPDGPTTGLLQSSFFQWSCQYFSKPLMSPSIESDPTCPRALEQEWRNTKRVKYLQEISSQKDRAANSKFDNQIALLDNETDMPSHVLLHPYENIIVSADDKETITVLNWEDSTKLNKFSNKNTPGSRISTINFLNTSHQPILLVGSDDGVVRIWRSYDDASGLQLASAWRVLNDIGASRRGSRGAGLVTDWTQEDGWLMTTGDVPIIRLWDCERCLSIQDIATATDASVTCLTHDKLGSRTIVAGFSDGTIRTYDCRTSRTYEVTATFDEHRSWAVNVQMPVAANTIVSGSVSGHVKIWDIRMRHSTKTYVTHSNNMTALAVHQYAPIIATGSQGQKVKIINFDGKELSQIKYHDGFLGQRIGPVSCLSFHPYKLLLAAGGTDAIISMYQSACYSL